MLTNPVCSILGCGSSLGSPWITNYNGKLKKDPKNQRTRCCAHVQKGNLSVLIDTSPDIKHQILKNKIKNLDSIIYTHEHADQTAGILNSTRGPRPLLKQLLNFQLFVVSNKQIK